MEKLNLVEQQRAARQPLKETTLTQHNFLTFSHTPVNWTGSFCAYVAKKWSLKGLNKAVCWYWHLETGTYVVNLLLTIGLIG